MRPRSAGQGQRSPSGRVCLPVEQTEARAQRLLAESEAELEQARGRAEEARGHARSELDRLNDAIAERRSRDGPQQRTPPGLPVRGAGAADAPASDGSPGNKGSRGRFLVVESLPPKRLHEDVSPSTGASTTAGTSASPSSKDLGTPRNITGSCAASSPSGLPACISASVHNGTPALSTLASSPLSSSSGLCTAAAAASNQPGTPAFKLSTWWRCIRSEGLAVRAAPDARGPRTGSLLQWGAAFCVSQEYLAEDAVLYLKLASGGGWAFEGLPGIGAICERCLSPGPRRCMSPT